MGDHECVGSHGARVTQKQDKKGTFEVSRVRIWGPMTGEISPDMMFEFFFVKNGQEWVQMGENRCGWVQ